MRIKEIKVKSILTRSRIPGVLYCLNPYTGCQHGCKYCYARFMKKFTGHLEKWGDFVDVKINAPAVLEKQLKTAKKEFISISTVTDPYQPLERIYQITRKCLEVLLKYQFPVSILTKSPLVLRDIDLLSQFHDSEVGVTITTGNDAIRKIFEPRAPSINQRIEILKGFHNQGVKTYAFI
ncbi:MAG: radical SAM protein, partial [Methanosarcinales archaeon]